MEQKLILKELAQLEKRQQRWFEKPEPQMGALRQKVYQHVPSTLRSTLELAFEKAFSLVFSSGTAAIEKTFSPEEAGLEFEASDLIFGRKSTRKNLKRLDKTAKSARFQNSAIAAAGGFGTGALGIALPEIPVFLGLILRSIYQIATAYGFDYQSEDEKIYILRLIRAALGGQKTAALVLKTPPQHAELAEEIKQCAKTLADALLVEKFVQSLPAVGVIGGFVNAAVCQKIGNFALLCYKKRYLEQKLVKK